MSMRFARRRTNLNERAESIVLAVYPDLRRFAAVVADPDVDPDDLVQDALISVLRGGSLETVDNPLAYLKRVVVNLSTSNRRRAARWRKLLPQVVPSDDHVDDYPSDVPSLAGLSPIDRAAIHLAELDGYSHTEIADLLGLSESAVSKRLSRARRKLREDLHTDMDTDMRTGICTGASAGMSTDHKIVEASL